MLTETTNEIEKSKIKLLNAIAGSTDITFIRNYGNIGDHLIHAGTRSLLSGIQYKEVSILNLSAAGGDLALISGGGGWCEAFGHMPRYLRLIEKKFRRVIVLPSSFDISVDSVSEALAETSALVFARERVSYEQIKGLCNADIAHDCAFFFDYSPYASSQANSGSGGLRAYRTDPEALPGDLPADNNDISMTCETLDEWLRIIAQYEVIRTDRAHVMIAAAMMGKRVFFRTSNYHKVAAIADYSLQAFPVSREEEIAPESVIESLKLETKKNLALLPRDFFERRREAEITIVMLSYRRLDRTISAIKALKENVAIPFKLLLVDNDSGPETRETLRGLSDAHDFIELVLLEQNLGCAGGRDFAMRRVKTRYAMLIDNDIEVLPGAIEHLLHCLESNPQALAATGRVILPDGSIHLCGGAYRIEEGVLDFELSGFGRRFDDWRGESGPCQWVPGCLTLLRSEALIDHPYDLGMRNYYEDLEWCYRLNQANNRSGEGTFHRVVESVAMHYHLMKEPNRALPETEKRKAAIKYIETIAYFYKIHGLLIPNIFIYVPELGGQFSPISRLSARIFLTLTNTHGSEWILEKWNNGELAPLFTGGFGDQRDHQECKRKISELEKDLGGLKETIEDIHSSKHWKLFDRYWRLRRAIVSLFVRNPS